MLVVPRFDPEDEVAVGGTQIAVRFVALSHTQTLAMSPAYTIDLVKRH